MFLDCLVNLILPISCHGIIFGTHMEALDMMGDDFSLSFPPYHQPSQSILPHLLGQFLYFYSLPRYVNVPELFGQPNIANILSWHYLWYPYGGFGHDGRWPQPVLVFLTISHPKAFCHLLGQFLYFYPLPRYVNVPELFGQPNIANILSWHYLWYPYGGFGHDRRWPQPVLPSLPSAIPKHLAIFWDNFCTFTYFQDM